MNLYYLSGDLLMAIHPSTSGKVQHNKHSVCRHHQRDLQMTFYYNNIIGKAHSPGAAAAAEIVLNNL